DRVLDSTPATDEEGVPTTGPDEMFKDFRNDEFEREAEERWGDTDAWKESKRRVDSYGPEDWKAMAAEARAINDGLLAEMQAGRPASSAEATALAEAHRQHISKWFYDCTPEIHVGLAEMYVTDDRFRAHYDAQAPGF